VPPRGKMLRCKDPVFVLAFLGRDRADVGPEPGLAVYGGSRAGPAPSRPFPPEAVGIRQSDLPADVNPIF